MKGLNNEKYLRCFLRSGKDFVKGMILYISENGCNGIRCSECCINKLCNHCPAGSSVTASRILLSLTYLESHQQV